jgi:hypothetical protein
MKISRPTTVLGDAAPRSDSKSSRISPYTPVSCAFSSGLTGARNVARRIL